MRFQYDLLMMHTFPLTVAYIFNYNTVERMNNRSKHRKYFGGLNMKKTYLLQGLDCAHCAAKIETEVRKIEGVSSATVNFMSTKMVIDADETLVDSIEKAAIKIVKKLEPDVAVKLA